MTKTAAAVTVPAASRGSSEQPGLAESVAPATAVVADERSSASGCSSSSSSGIESTDYLTSSNSPCNTTSRSRCFISIWSTWYCLIIITLHIYLYVNRVTDLVRLIGNYQLILKSKTNNNNNNNINRLSSNYHHVRDNHDSLSSSPFASKSSSTFISSTSNLLNDMFNTSDALLMEIVTRGALLVISFLFLIVFLITSLKQIGNYSNDGVKFGRDFFREKLHHHHHHHLHNHQHQRHKSPTPASPSSNTNSDQIVIELTSTAAAKTDSTSTLMSSNRKGCCWPIRNLFATIWRHFLPINSFSHLCSIIFLIFPQLIYPEFKNFNRACSHLSLSNQEMSRLTSHFFYFIQQHQHEQYQSSMIQLRSNLTSSTVEERYNSGNDHHDPANQMRIIQIPQNSRALSFVANLSSCLLNSLITQTATTNDLGDDDNSAIYYNTQFFDEQIQTNIIELISICCALISLYIRYGSVFWFTNKTLSFLITFIGFVGSIEQLFQLYSFIYINRHLILISTMASLMKATIFDLFPMVRLFETARLPPFNDSFDLFNTINSTTTTTTTTMSMSSSTQPSSGVWSSVDKSNSILQAVFQPLVSDAGPLSSEQQHHQMSSYGRISTGATLAAIASSLDANLLLRTKFTLLFLYILLSVFVYFSATPAYAFAYLKYKERFLIEESLFLRSIISIDDDFNNNSNSKKEKTMLKATPAAVAQSNSQLIDDNSHLSPIYMTSNNSVVNHHHHPNQNPQNQNAASTIQMKPNKNNNNIIYNLPPLTANTNVTMAEPLLTEQASSCCFNYCPHLIATIQLVMICACKIPFCYDYIIYYNEYKDFGIMLTIIIEILHTLILLFVWLTLTLKNEWTMHLQTAFSICHWTYHLRFREQNENAKLKMIMLQQQQHQQQNKQQIIKQQQPLEDGIIIQCDNSNNKYIYASINKRLATESAQQQHQPPISNKTMLSSTPNGHNNSNNINNNNNRCSIVNYDLINNKVNNNNNNNNANYVNISANNYDDNQQNNATMTLMNGILINSSSRDYESRQSLNNNNNNNNNCNKLMHRHSHMIQPFALQSGGGSVKIRNTDYGSSLQQQQRPNYPIATINGGSASSHSRRALMEQKHVSMCCDTIANSKHHHPPPLTLFSSGGVGGNNSMRNDVCLVLKNATCIKSAKDPTSNEYLLNSETMYRNEIRKSIRNVMLPQSSCGGVQLPIRIEQHSRTPLTNVKQLAQSATVNVSSQNNTITSTASSSSNNNFKNTISASSSKVHQRKLVPMRNGYLSSVNTTTTTNNNSSNEFHQQQPNQSADLNNVVVEPSRTVLYLNRDDGAGGGDADRPSTSASSSSEYESRV